MKSCDSCHTQNHPRRRNCTHCGKYFPAKAVEKPATVQTPEAMTVGILSGFNSEINEMENMILFYQNRIIKKRIAMQEIINSRF